MWQFEDEVAGKEVTQAYLADMEEDLLLGDADTAVAQALLNEQQLQKLTDARKARRARLAAQAKRQKERQLAADQEAVQEQQRQQQTAKANPTPAAPKAQPQPQPQQRQLAVDQEALKKQLQQQRVAQAKPTAPAAPKTQLPAAIATLTSERLAALVTQQQTKAIDRASKPDEIERYKMDALNAILVGFERETERQRLKRNEQQDVQRHTDKIIKPAAGGVTPISLLPSQVGGDETSDNTGERL
jgi:hypothetical protein